MRVKKLLICAFGALLLSGCATMYPKANISPMGEYSPEKEKSLSAEVTKITDSSGVKVFGSTVPEGLSLSEQGSKLEVVPGFESRYEVLASVDVSFPFSDASVNNFYWTWDYRSSARNGWCVWQVPLKILTIGIWSVLSPLNWPCIANMPGDELERKALLVEEAKRAAKVMGANTIIIAGTSDLRVTTVSSGAYGASTSVMDHNIVRMAAYLVKEKL